MPNVWPNCTVAVCTRNRADALLRCLKSVTAVEYPNLEILIVNNGVDDEHTRAIAHDAGAQYVVEPVAGLSRARNRAAQHGRTDILAYIDDDCVADRRWLANLIPNFADPSVAIVSGNIRPVRIQTEAEHFCAELRWMDLGEQHRVISADIPGWFEIINSQGIGFGGNMAVRRSVFERWPGFEPRLGLGSRIASGEENLAFLQLLSLGYKIVFEPLAVVYHPYPERMKDLRSRALELHAATTAFYVFLLAEYPEYRRLVLRHLFGRTQATDRRTLNSINTRFAIAIARFRGLFRYLDSRFRPGP